MSDFRPAKSKSGKSDDDKLDRTPSFGKRSMRVQVLLPTDKHMVLTIQPSLLGSELFDMAASRFKLREKEPFGLLLDTGEEDRRIWLDMNTKVVSQVEHILGKQGNRDSIRRHGNDTLARKRLPAIIHMSFCARYFGGHVTMFVDFITQKLIFWEARRLLYKGAIRCSKEVTVQLIALALQVEEGDHLSDSATINLVNTLNLLPSQTIVEFGHSMQNCYEAVNQHYKSLTDMTEQSAVLAYMTIIQQHPTYGLHYYKVTDDKNIRHLLGIGPHGIAQYDASDKHTPRKSWAWKTLENVSWSKQKFTLELNEDDVTSMYIWKTPSAADSQDMVKMVQFQHENSIRSKKKAEKSQSRRRAKLAAGTSTTMLGSPGGRPLSTMSAVSEQPQLYRDAAALDINIPARAKSVMGLLADAQDTPTKSALSPAIHTFNENSAAAHHPPPLMSDSISDTFNERGNLDALERRRDQIFAELSRKRKQLDQLLEEEKLFGPFDSNVVESVQALLNKDASTLPLSSTGTSPILSRGGSRVNAVARAIAAKPKQRRFHPPSTPTAEEEVAIGAKARSKQRRPRSHGEPINELGLFVVGVCGGGGGGSGVVVVLVMLLLVVDGSCCGDGSGGCCVGGGDGDGGGAGKKNN